MITVFYDKEQKGYKVTGKRPGAKYAAVQRLNALMADHQKRSKAKAEARERGEPLTPFTTNKIHAYESRNNYQAVVMRFLNWCRDQHNLRDLARIDEQADELASLYLLERIEQEKSAWTLATERSALRMFFQSRTLTDSIELPERRREDIKRSRLPAKRDSQINLDNWRHVTDFCLACGLRREEQSVLSQVTDRPPDEHVFARISGLLDIHSYRRRFAQDLYEHLSGKPLPPVQGRLHSKELDRDAALVVSRCLGHNRIEIIFGHYLR